MCVNSRGTRGGALAIVLLLSVGASACGAKRPPLREVELDEVERLRRNVVKVNHSIEVTKKLIIASKDRPYLADLNRRLGELYSEVSRYHYLLAAERARESGSTEIDSAEAQLAKELAIGTYKKLLDEFPRYKDRDRTIFALAHEYRELADHENMLKTYDRLFASHPESPLVLEAYLVVGDYNFKEKKNFPEATKYYRKILDKPESKYHPMARHKLAWVHINELEWKEAFALLEEVVADKDTKEGRVDLRSDALLDLAYVYKEVRDYEKAIPFFRNLAPNKEAYQTALAKLGAHYYREANWHGAAALYRELLEISYTLGNTVDYGHRLYEAIRKSSSWKHASSDVKLFIRVLNAYEGSWRYTEEDKSKLRADFEIYTRDISTKLHLYTKKTATDLTEDGATSEASRAKYSDVADAYEPYLAAFPDSPKMMEMLENQADALYAARRFIDAGLHYEKIAAVAKTDAEALRVAIYAAISSYFNALKVPEDLTKFEKVLAREGLRTYGRYYIKAFPDAKDVAQVKFNIARTYYDEGSYEKAVELCSSFLREYPGHEAAPICGHLALDALATLGNYEKVAKVGKEFLKVSGLDPTFSKEVDAIVKSAESRELAEVTLGAEGDSGDELAMYARRKKGTGLGETALYNAFVKAMDTKDYSKIFEYGYEFVREYGKSPKIASVLSALAKISADVADFPRAMIYLDEAYRRSEGAEAIGRLMALAGIQGGLARYAEASKTYRLLMERLPAGPDKRDAAMKAASLYLDAGDWAGLKALMEEYVPEDPRSAQANFLLGYAYYRTGARAEAGPHFEAALRALSDKDGAEVDAAGRAAFYLGEIAFADLRDFKFGGEFDSTETLEFKKAKMDDVELLYKTILKTGSGTWAVAGLARLAAVYNHFADFLADYPLPPELSAADRKALSKGLAENVAVYKRNAKDTLEACAAQAKKLEVFTSFARACLEGRIYMEDPDSGRGSPPRKVLKDPPKEAAALRGALLKNSKDAASLNKLGALYILGGDVHYAGLILGKAIASKTADAATHHLLGVVALHMDEPETAAYEFREALKKTPGLGHTRLNLACIFIEHGYLAKGKAELKKVAGLDKISLSDYDLHPGVRACLSTAGVDSETPGEAP